MISISRTRLAVLLEAGKEAKGLLLASTNLIPLSVTVRERIASSTPRNFISSRPAPTTSICWPAVRRALERSIMVVRMLFLFRRRARAGPAMPAPEMRIWVWGDILGGELRGGW